MATQNSASLLSFIALPCRHPHADAVQAHGVPTPFSGPESFGSWLSRPPSATGLPTVAAHPERIPVRAGAPVGLVGYFLVAQNMSANSLVAVSRSAAACASTPCLFLPASFSRFQTFVWRSGNAARCSGLK